MKRGTKTSDLKRLTIERCQGYGWNPKNNDEADALGILDYAIDLNGITPPWAHQQVLRRFA
jgi:hypothetical protein